MSAFGETTILARHHVRYYRCPDCGLLTLPEPTWLDEAYENPIYAGDEGLLRRSRIAAHFTSAIIRSERLSSGSFLDWAGGYGTFTRMMRDKGFDYYTADPYTENVLAPGYEGDETATYAMVTAFEVLEHLPDPIRQLHGIAQQTDLMLFSTELQPSPPPDPGQWWYYQEESGQHVTFHTRESLRRLAQHLGFRLTTNGTQFHLFHRRSLAPTTRLLLSPTLVRGGRGLVRAARDVRGRLNAAQ